MAWLLNILQDSLQVEVLILTSSPNSSCNYNLSINVSLTFQWIHDSLLSVVNYCVTLLHHVKWLPISALKVAAIKWWINGTPCLTKTKLGCLLKQKPAPTILSHCLALGRKNKLGLHNWLQSVLVPRKPRVPVYCVCYLTEGPETSCNLKWANTLLICCETLQNRSD